MSVRSTGSPSRAVKLADAAVQLRRLEAIVGAGASASSRVRARARQAAYGLEGSAHNVISRASSVPGGPPPWSIRIIARALADAREKGLDHIDQTGHAVLAVMAARPDITASAALQAINRWQRG